jgi:hypothetical protein
MHTVVGITKEGTSAYNEGLIKFWDGLYLYFDLVPDTSFNLEKVVIGSQGGKLTIPLRPVFGGDYNDRFVPMGSQRNGSLSNFSVLQEQDHVTIHGEENIPLAPSVLDCVTRLLDVSETDITWTGGCYP